MTVRLQKINSITRKAKMKAIVRKAVYVPIEDEANPDLELEPQESPAIQDEDLSDMGDSGVNDPKAERLDLIRERAEALRRKKNKEYQKENEGLRHEFRNHEVPYNINMALAKYKTLMEESGKSGYDPKVLKEEMDSLVEQFPELPEIMEQLKAKDEHFEKVWERYVRLFGEPDETEEPYDRSKDQIKNEQAKQELEESIQEVERGGQDSGKERKFEVDDVLVLADTMYTREEAKKQLGNMSMETLKKQVIDKAKQLGLIKSKEEAVQAYLEGKFTTAEEDEDDEDDAKPLDKETSDQYAEYAEMSTYDKIMGASYVQLYALNKFFTKLLKDNKKVDPVEKEEDGIDAEELARIQRSRGIKERPEHGEGRSILKNLSPEQLKKYEMMGSKAKAKFSIREADSMSGIDFNMEAGAPKSKSEMHKEKVDIEEDTCDLCHKKHCVCK